jgi:hypothetical protein
LQVFMVFPICFFHAMTVRVAPSALLGEEWTPARSTKHQAKLKPWFFLLQWIWAGLWWLMPVILATWELAIRIAVQGLPRQIVHETPISKITWAKWTGGVDQVVECLLCEPSVHTVVPPKTGWVTGSYNRYTSKKTTGEICLLAKKSKGEDHEFYFS